MKQARALENQESLLTVIVALAANGLVAIAKTVAAVLTGSASMLAEAAHSWADTGNEIFLLIAKRLSARPPDATHPMGYGREVYIWSMFAAIGLFALGAGVSVTHGVRELIEPEPAGSFTVAYIVLAIAFVLEGASFIQVWRSMHQSSRHWDRTLLEQVYRTSDPTDRAIFFEDGAALAGILIAAVGIGLHDLTGSPVPDAIGSILVGILLGVVSVSLIARNRDFLLGQVADPKARAGMLAVLEQDPRIEKVTELYLEIVGVRSIMVIGAVDLAGNPREHIAARTLADIEWSLQENPAIVKAVLSLSEPDRTDG